MDVSDKARAAGALASIIEKHCGVQGALVRACPNIDDLPDDLLP